MNKYLLTGLSISTILTNVTSQNLRSSGEKNNILFIICDDLRPELECYNHPLVKTPHMNKLASEGVLFNRAYCNIAVSGASRASLLTGLRPTKNKFVDWNMRIDKEVPEAVTLNQYFNQAGYTTVSNGKVFHHKNEAACKYWDDMMPPVRHNPLDYQTEKNIRLMNENEKNGIKKRGYFYEDGYSSESGCTDWRIAQKSIEDLKRLAQNDNPFFMAVGFIRPHLPFSAPQKYWDLYDREKIKIPDNYVLKDGNNIPKRALTFWGELTAYSGIPDKDPLNEETAKTMIHGYYAAVSFVDAMIGLLLDEVKNLGLDRNTTIVLIGDHGWNLGEHGMWCKHSIMNTSRHSPLIIKTPGGLKGYRTNQIAEYIDLFPTFCDMAEMEKPGQLEGESLFPLLFDKHAKTKGYAVSRWKNGFTYTDDQYSYTEWWDENDKVVDHMLFEHTTDEEENYNLTHTYWYKDTLLELSDKLKKARGDRYSQ